MKYMFYRLIHLDPNSNLSSLSFKKPYVENNRVWRIGDSSLHLCEEKDHLYSILSTRHTQGPVKTTPVKMSVEDHAKLASHLHAKGWMTRFRIGDLMDDDDEAIEFLESEIYELEKIMKHPEQHQPTPVERIGHLIKEIAQGGISLNTLQITIKTDEGFSTFDFHSNGSVLLDRSFLKNQDEPERFVREFLLEVATVLGLISPTDTLQPITLNLQEYVPHPLTNMEKVLDSLYASITPEQLATTGLSSEELEDIRLSLFASARRIKGKEVTVKERETMKQDLRKKA